MLKFVRFFILFSLAFSQKFTLDGDASTIEMTDDVTFTLYNEDKFYLVDSAGVSALSFSQSDTCSMELDRRMVVHGNMLASAEKLFKTENYDQWKLAQIEDFQGQISGWSEDDISSCNNSPDLFLGGYCKFSSEVVTKTFTLPAHNYVMFQMTFHFFDKWEGESAYLKVDGNYAWVESFVACNNLHSSLCTYKGINVCGDDYTDRLGYHVRHVAAHTAEELSIEISSTLTKDPCEASWGIDDIQIFVK